MEVTKARKEREFGTQASGAQYRPQLYLRGSDSISKSFRWWLPWFAVFLRGKMLRHRPLAPRFS